MKKRTISIVLLTLLVSLVAGPGRAHVCEDEQQTDCEDTPVTREWRGNYIPLFDAVGRDDPAVRYHLQRWREECKNNQMCQWSYGGFSLVPGGSPTPTPNEWHTGFAATHCFLFEAAHQCENHDPSSGEGVHDAHGGAIAIDLCLVPNPEPRALCDEGLKDTQITITIMDHFDCGTFVPILSCTDEYHVLRPFDGDYTYQQMQMTLAWIDGLLADPESFLKTYICGYADSPGYDDCIYA